MPSPPEVQCPAYANFTTRAPVIAHIPYRLATSRIEPPPPPPPSSVSTFTFTITATSPPPPSTSNTIHAIHDQLSGTPWPTSAQISTNPGERYQNSISTPFSTYGPTETHATHRKKANFPKKVYFPIHTTWYALEVPCVSVYWMGNWINFTLARRRTIRTGTAFSRAEFLR